ncbi:MAG: glycoside hydrolase family 5 protein [Robiginitomaculum sp.]|nr:glycoside hydrolase family 5 protein [Robiginitomaculum sp.]MDQ7078381.1 glycoside hydrolase family 5 protein [Robiginitomaculum sp.]
MKANHVLLAMLAVLIAASVPAQAKAQHAAFPARRCVNLANALNAPKEGEWGYVIRDADLQRIARAGFDSVRVLIAWDQHAGAKPPYTIDPSFFARIDEVIAQAQGYGLSIILDMHNYEDLYANPTSHGPRAIALWMQIARHYAKAPQSVIFELLNEPKDALQGEVWQRLSAQLYQTVRHSNPDRWIIMGGDNWNSIDGLARFSAPPDPQLVLTFHYYDPYKFTHQGASWFEGAPPVGRSWGSKAEKRHLKTEFSRAAALGRAKGHQIWLGEFGATTATHIEDRARWTRAVRRAAEAAGMGWCSFDFATEFGVYSPKRQNWIWPLRHALFDQAALALRRSPD